MTAEKVCENCRWWVGRGSDTTVEPFDSATACVMPAHRATGVESSSGRLSHVFTLPDFGCNQWQHKE